LPPLDYHPPFIPKKRSPAGVRQASGRGRGRAAWRLLRRCLPGPTAEPRRLAKLIQRLRPDVVHSLELQHAGELTLAARQQCDVFPTWMVTNWGSDIDLFGRLPEHRRRLRQMLQACDVYTCECQRDVAAARALGFPGETWPVMPNAGGLDLQLVRQLRQQPTSRRRVIAIKGYQHWAGRALVALKAASLCRELLRNYEIKIYKASPDVQLAAQLLRADARLNVQLLDEMPHQQMLRLHGSARVSIGLSIGDGASTSFLEALAMGAFPLQSRTAAAHEWIANGVSGAIVEPEDPHEVAAALTRALQDDPLVDQAAERNWATACQRLDATKIAARVRQLYQETAGRENRRPPAGQGTTAPARRVA
jgi:hypothetical protein